MRGARPLPAGHGRVPAAGRAPAPRARAAGPAPTTFIVERAGDIDRRARARRRGQGGAELRGRRTRCRGPHRSARRDRASALRDLETFLAGGAGAWRARRAHHPRPRPRIGSGEGPYCGRRSGIGWAAPAAERCGVMAFVSARRVRRRRRDAGIAAPPLRARAHCLAPRAGHSPVRPQPRIRNQSARQNSQGECNEHSHRDQRVRPHRPAGLPRPARAGPGRQGGRGRRRRRHRPGRQPGLPAEVRLHAGPVQRQRQLEEVAADKAEDDVLVVNGKEIAVVSAKTPAELPWKAAGRRLRHRVDRPVHRGREGQGPPRRRREEGDHLRARPRARTSPS